MLKGKGILSQFRKEKAALPVGLAISPAPAAPQGRPRIIAMPGRGGGKGLKKSSHPLDQASFKRLLEAAETPRDRMILRLIGSAGVPVGEVGMIRLESLDMLKGILSLPSVDIQMRESLPDLWDALYSYLRFAGPLEMSRVSVYRLIRETANRAGLEGLTARDLSNFSQPG